MSNEPQRPSLEELRIDRTAAPARLGAGRIWLGLLVCLVIGGLLVFYFRQAAPVVVRAEPVREVAGAGSPRTLLNASGYVVARREATVSSKFTGKVLEVLVEEGMRVREGQVLARLDASNVEANLRLAEAQLESAGAMIAETEVRLAEARAELRRIAGLAAERIASEAELDRATAEVKSLEARLDRQRAEVEVANRQVAVWRQQIEDSIITAPFAGVVTSKNAQPGEMISPMSAGGGFTRTGICTIVDMDSLEIEIDVNESYINRVEPEQPVQAVLDAYPGWTIACQVIAIVPTADRQKATVRVRVGFDKLDPRILPQMGVKVAFQAGEEPSAGAAARRLVATSAVLQRDGRAFVWVVRDGRLERRVITVGASEPDGISVMGGLAAGELVVVDPGATLQDGAKVRIENP